MGNISHYKRTFEKKVRQFNKPARFSEYFSPLIGDKQAVTIAELGAGPVVTIGTYWPGVDVSIVASDKEWKQYADLWNEKPLVPIEHQDMEALTYEDNSFDIVHCRNALDHTKNAFQAVKEMKRVCKPGGYVYLLHAEGQRRIYGGHHYHNIEELELDDFTVTQDGKWVIHIWQK